MTGDDLKDTNKVAAYTDAKKAFDDYTSQAKLEPLAVKLSDSVGHNRVAINFMWTLVTGFLVMFMQAGFALVETGLCRAKNAGHTMSMNFMIYPMGMLGFYVCGFAFMFGGLGGIGTMGGYGGLNHEITWTIFGHPFGILGWKGFMLQGAGYDTAAFALFLFQMVFMDTTATIPTGGAAERWKFSAFMIYGCCIGTIMYPLFGNWVWGGGWLSQLGSNFPALGHGHVDFAGSSVVHMQGGVICLIFCWLIGPRHGKYDKNGKIVHPITAAQHSVRHAGHVHSGVRLVRIQSRLNPRRHGPAHRRGRGQHHAGLGHRRSGRNVVDVVVQDQETRSVHDVQRHAGRFGGHHRSLRVRECGRRDRSSASSPAFSWLSRCSSSRKSALMIASAPSRFTGSTARGAACRSVCSPMALTATAGTAFRATVRGLFYGGGMGQFWAELIGVTTCFVTLSVLSMIVYYIAEKTRGQPGFPGR